MTIREETHHDKDAIHRIHIAAFGHPDEADLVDNLRTEGAVLLSLVADLEDQIVGHILFTRMSIEASGSSVPAVALAPVAVLPAHQRQGIGKQLIRHGLELLRNSGERIVIVLGHPAYYQQFGFSQEKARTLESTFPPEAYMAMELVPGALEGIHGKVKYPPAFGILDDGS